MVGDKTPHAMSVKGIGCLIAYHLCLKIDHNNLLKPKHLFVSGHNVPSIPIHSQVKNVSMLPNKEFIARLAKLGGIPDEVLKEKELLELFLPNFKSRF